LISGKMIDTRNHISLPDEEKNICFPRKLSSG
jgi:hypothetical protein